MKVRLLHPDRDAEIRPTHTPGAADLTADLDLQPVFDLMVPSRHLRDVPHLLLRPLTDPGEIRMRQDVLADAIAHPASMTGLLALAEGALERQRSAWMSAGRTADSLLISSLYALTAVLPSMRELAQFARQHLPTSTSPGLAALYRRLIDELDADYLDEVASLLAQLQTSSGVVVRAKLTDGVMVGALELLAPRPGRRTLRNVLGLETPSRLKVTLTEADDAGARALGELRNDAIYQ
ncbi:MAG TPA: hypothetical protein VLR88_08445, partial [Propionibacteriaceae bacterium]|nr:hypothetical protein [Propionibacteriaceae bacterium]